MEIPKDIQEKLGMNFNYKNYKTLINTGIVASVPLLGTIIAVPYAFNAWLTDIQKKAGKIGIMKAMDKIDDPRVLHQKQLLLLILQKLRNQSLLKWQRTQILNC